MNNKLVFILVFFYSLLGYSEMNMKEFIKNCAYGTAYGALAGTVSLAFVDKPSAHLNNISKGASLGLYSGIAYSFLMNQNDQIAEVESPRDSQILLVPSVYENNLGAQFFIFKSF